MWHIWSCEDIVKIERHEHAFDYTAAPLIAFFQRTGKTDMNSRAANPRVFSRAEIGETVSPAAVKSRHEHPRRAFKTYASPVRPVQLVARVPSPQSAFDVAFRRFNIVWTKERCRLAHAVELVDDVPFAVHCDNRILSVFPSAVDRRGLARILVGLPVVHLLLERHPSAVRRLVIAVHVYPVERALTVRSIGIVTVPQCPQLEVLPSQPRLADLDAAGAVPLVVPGLRVVAPLLHGGPDVVQLRHAIVHEQLA